MKNNENKNETSIFNPLSTDLTVGWDLQGKNPRSFLLRAKEVTSIPDEFVKHVKRTLADAIFDAIGDYRKEREMQMQDIYEKMKV